MSIFRRRSANHAPRHGSDLTLEQADRHDDLSEVESAADLVAGTGPHDVADVPAADGRLDLGSLRIAGHGRMELRLEIEQSTGTPTAATIVIDDSQLQLQAFAAPRSSGIWGEIREEIASAVSGQGGTAEIVEGPVGTELRVRMPSQGADGRTVFAPARFLGADGPRWFLRGVLTGRAAIDETAAAPFVDLFCSTVVVRGADPMAPRELLPLTLPEVVGEASGAVPSAPAVGDLNPFERGPEITEVH